MKIIMLEKGEYCDSCGPIIKVEEGEVKEFSDKLTASLLGAGKAKVYKKVDKKDDDKPADNPDDDKPQEGAVDAAEALGVDPAVLDKAKAEKKGKPGKKGRRGK